MFVRDRMSSPVITVAPNTAFQDALKQMRDHGFRRLPVVGLNGKLVGIVSERDLLHAAPSSATSLSIWEVSYLLWRIQVRELMTRDVIITAPDTPIEDAASLMVTNKVGGLPVVDGNGKVVGIITETDIFETFVEMLAGGQAGVRLTLQVPEKKGVLATLSRAIADLGGSIVGVGSFHSGIAGEREMVVKVRHVSQGQLVDTLEALGDRVVDARDV